MPRAKCKWRQTEMTRAMRAVEKATGKPVARVEIDQTGKLSCSPAATTSLTPRPCATNGTKRLNDKN